MFSTTPSSQSSKRAHEKEGAVPSRFGVELEFLAAQQLKSHGF